MYLKDNEAYSISIIARVMTWHNPALPIVRLLGGVEKDHFNRRALKVVAKDAELKHYKDVLCYPGESRYIGISDLCACPERSVGG